MVGEYTHPTCPSCESYNFTLGPSPQPLYVPPKRLQYHSRWPRHGPAVMPSEFDPALGASSPWESMSP
ncbi:MAG: hypothetical protein JWP03_1969, partial [Phycisphaerales bacterium]|nr:hypothetical protein [Phycisphaerales bacterium]